ncbi:crossover junction endodeoxyribonuclease RuvC [Gammaproteobacteria bacterium]|jgi:crossover junction endodeoxyribonuclease RuvC|nr:crossover junction endodeoxyribonuclease RuvC [Gammaproteobacteria bacterium]
MIHSNALILGLDPGSRKAGYGIVTSHRQYVTSGCIRLNEPELNDRLVTLYQSINQILKAHPQIQRCAIEQVFMAKNAQSALKLGHARGVLVLAVKSKGIDVFDYSARRVKQCVTGMGQADKQQVGTMVTRLLNLSKQPQEDAADALAVALTDATEGLFHAKIGAAS